MHPNGQRQLREVVIGWTGPASRLPVTIPLPRWLVVYRDSPHQHTGIVRSSGPIIQSSVSIPVVIL